MALPLDGRFHAGGSSVRPHAIRSARCEMGRWAWRPRAGESEPQPRPRSRRLERFGPPGRSPGRAQRLPRNPAYGPEARRQLAALGPLGP